MINDDLKKLQEEIDKLQIKASTLDKIGSLINSYIIRKQKIIEVEIIRKIVYEAFDKIRYLNHKNNVEAQSQTKLEDK